jgi:hypothetical protein
VKVPHIRIAQFMAVVALIALDCVLVREVAQSRFYSPFIEWCLVGALPIPNVLALVIYCLVTQKRRELRAFLSGFAYFGAAAMVCSLALSWFFPEAARYPLRSALNPMFARMGSPDSSRPIFLAAAAALVLLPQVAIALTGGLLISRFTFAGRPDQRPGRLGARTSI